MHITRRDVILGIVASAAIGMARPALAAVSVTLGEVNIGAKGGKARLEIPENLDRFSHLNLRVSGGPVVVAEINVTFKNGQRARVPLKQTVGPGKETGFFLLPGQVRALAVVEATFAGGEGTGAARVTVVGRKV